MLGWQKERNGQMVGGYLLDKSTDTMPIFVKYASSQYEDQFLNPQEMSWYSKNDRSLKSPEFQWMAKGTGDDWDRTHFIPLFVMRKEEADDSRTKQFRKYYYVGHVAAVRNSRVVTKPDATGEQTTKVVLSTLRLDRPLDPELYRHITGTYIG